MTQAIGLIEIEADGWVSASDPGFDTHTLDGLFACLVGGPSAAAESSDLDEPGEVLLANLDGLAADLRRATRNVLSEIFRPRRHD